MKRKRDGVGVKCQKHTKRNETKREKKRHFVFLLIFGFTYVPASFFKYSMFRLTFLAARFLRVRTAEKLRASCYLSSQNLTHTTSTTAEEAAKRFCVCFLEKLQVNRGWT